MPESNFPASIVAPPHEETPVVVAPATEAAPTIPDKFMKDGKPDYAALTKSYLELEQKNTVPSATPNKPEATPPAPPTPAPVKKMEKWTKEWTEGGSKLSDATYTEIANDLGLTKTEVDSYISSRTQAGNDFNTKVFESVGGQEKYGLIADWANANLKAEEVEPYNRALKSGDLGVVTIALKGLVAQYEQSRGHDPKLVSATPSSTPNDQAPFVNVEAAAFAKQDKRYGKDPEYTAMVTNRIRLSTW